MENMTEPTGGSPDARLPADPSSALSTSAPPHPAGQACNCAHGQPATTERPPAGRQSPYSRALERYRLR